MQSSGVPLAVHAELMTVIQAAAFKALLLASCMRHLVCRELLNEQGAQMVNELCTCQAARTLLRPNLQ